MRTAPRRRSSAQESDATLAPRSLAPALPLPWEVWPAETRLLLGMTALWSLVGLLVLTSASWWVADREMGDAAYYLKRQLLWLLASWALFGWRSKPACGAGCTSARLAYWWAWCWWPPPW